LVRKHPNVVSSLMQCGLLKFFLCPFMRAQPRLLNALVDYWHPDTEAFMLEGNSLVPTIEDIYFFTGLSRRGEPVNFWTFPSGPHNISELIGLYCEVWYRPIELSGANKQDHRFITTGDCVAYWADDCCNSTLDIPCTDELCSPVLKCTDI
jgi:hypothetical protein